MCGLGVTTSERRPATVMPCAAMPANLAGLLVNSSMLPTCNRRNHKAAGRQKVIEWSGAEEAILRSLRETRMKAGVSAEDLQRCV